MAWFNCNTAIGQFTAAQIEKTKADIVNFHSNVGNIIIPEIKASISPVQAGSGDPSPSNIRPITGWDSVKVSATGKNLLPKENKNPTYFSVDSDGYFSQNNPSSAPFGWNYANRLAEITLPAGTYTLSFTAKTVSTNASARMRLYDSNDTLIGEKTGTNVGHDSFSFTLTSTTSVGVVSKIYDGVWGFQIESGSSATSYEPFGQTATITLPHTVYGAEHDVDSGVGDETWTRVDLSTLSYTRSASGLFTTTSLSNVIEKAPSASAPSPYIMCEIYNPISSNSITGPQGATPSPNYSMAENVGGILYFNCEDETDIDDFKTLMTGVYLYYRVKIGTETTYQATPAQLQARNGTNNVWSDAGQTSLKYYEIYGYSLDGLFETSTPNLSLTQNSINATDFIET